MMLDQKPPPSTEDASKESRRRSRKEHSPKKVRGRSQELPLKSEPRPPQQQQRAGSLGPDVVLGSGKSNNVKGKRKSKSKIRKLPPEEEQADGGGEKTSRRKSGRSHKKDSSASSAASGDPDELLRELKSEDLPEGSLKLAPDASSSSLRTRPKIRSRSPRKRDMGGSINGIKTRHVAATAPENETTTTAESSLRTSSTTIVSTEMKAMRLQWERENGHKVVETQTPPPLSIQMHEETDKKKKKRAKSSSSKSKRKILSAPNLASSTSSSTTRDNTNTLVKNQPWPNPENK